MFQIKLILRFLCINEHLLTFYPVFNICVFVRHYLFFAYDLTCPLLHLLCGDIHTSAVFLSISWMRSSAVWITATYSKPLYLLVDFLLLFNLSISVRCDVAVAQPQIIFSGLHQGDSHSKGAGAQVHSLPISCCFK